MKTIKYRIKDPLGFHARPVGKMVQVVNKLSSNITIHYAGKEANAKRLFSVLSLGVKVNSEITIVIEGEDEEEAEALILNLFEKENI